MIFASAMQNVLDKIKAFRVEAADYVTKPFQYEEVVTRIENQLGIRRLQKDLEQKK